MDISYSTFIVELTRKCSEACDHCCRGDAEDVDLTEETVDEFFLKNKVIYIGTLIFSGGEPMLNGHMLEYFVDKLIEYKVHVEFFAVGINGLNYSEEAVRGLTKLYDYIVATSDYERLCPGILMVTQDQYHLPYNEEVVSKLSHLSFLSPIKTCEVSEDTLEPYGRAYNNKLTNKPQNLDDLTNYQKNFSIKEYEGHRFILVEFQYLSANGNFVNDGCQDYKLMDKYALGNVKTTSVEEIYLDGPKKLKIS